MQEFPNTEDLKVIPIPVIENQDLFDRNESRAYENSFEACPCCGKAIKNPQYFFHSVYGGMAYIPLTGLGEHSDGQYDNTWIMGVGSECRKKFPQGYIFGIDKLDKLRNE
jgi:hypothetical protein